MSSWANLDRVSQLFISHSNQDKTIVEALALRLRQQGHKSLFIDFDAEGGIPSGSKWLRELYRNLDACEGVIVVCSEHSMASNWCFAEIAIACRQGKNIFPIKVAPCRLPSLLEDFQVTDFTRGEAEGYERLWRGLKAAGIDPQDWPDENPDRPPYPGLASFLEEDAPLFFGRNAEITKGLETLRQIRIPGDGSLLLLLGASGSGKSSLVRAGLLPRLKRSRDWLVVDPFRPGSRPFDRLQGCLVDAFLGWGSDQMPPELPRLLLEGPPGEALHAAASGLRRASGRKEATVLFTIDQLEELLDTEQRETSARFLAFWSAALGAGRPGVIVFATLRSDFLASFQKHPALQDLRYQMLALGPMDLQGFRAVIEGPAKRAGIELEEGLVEELLEDTSTPDALPLLAFVLRELWERGGEDRRLTRAEYRMEIQGLEGAIGRVAESALGANRLSEAQWQALRRAFRQLVRVNDDKQLVRQKADWGALPPESHPLLQRLVERRLLVSGSAMPADALAGTEPCASQTLEVTHEALFRAWPLLREWLKSDEDFLFWRRRLRVAMEGWNEANKDPDSLLSGRRLDEARKWFSAYADDLGSEERHFIAEGLRREKRRKRLRITLLAATVSVITALGLAALYARIEAVEAERERLAQMAANQRQQGIDARDYQDNPLKAAMYFLLAADSYGDRDEASSARRAAELVVGDVRLREILDAGEGIEEVDIQPSADLVLTRHGFGQIRLMNFRSGGAAGEIPVPDRTEPAGARFTADGRVLYRSRAGNLGIHRAVSVGAPATEELGGDIGGIELDAAGGRALTWSEDKVYVWSLADGTRLHTLDHESSRPEGEKPGGRVSGAWISGDGRRVASCYVDDGCVLWDADRGNVLALLPLGGRWLRPRFSPNGRRLLHFSAGVLRLIDSETARVVAERKVAQDEGDPEGGLFFPDGERFLVWTSSGLVAIWDTPAFAPTQSPPQKHDGESIHTPEIRRDGERVLVRHGSTLSLWDPRGTFRIDIKSPSSLLGARLDDGGSRVLGWGADDQARVWDAGTGQLIGMPMWHQGLRAAAFLSQGQEALTWARDGTLRLWSVGESSPLTGRALRIEGILAAGLDAQGETAVTVAHGETARWDRRWRPLDERRRLFSDDEVEGVVLNPDSTKLLGWSSDALTLWSTRTGEVIGRKTLPTGVDTRGLKARFSQDASRIILLGHRFPARLWVPGANASDLFVLEGAPDLLDAGFSVQGRWVLGRDHDFRLHRWDARDGSRAGPREGIEQPWLFGMEYHEKAALLVTWDSRGELRFWDPDSGASRGEPLIHKAPIAGAAFDASGSRLLTWSDEGEAQLWDIHKRSRVFGAVFHRGRKVRALWSADGTRFLTADFGSLRVWDEAGFPLTPMLLNDANNTTVTAGPRGEVVLAWNIDQLRRWDLAPGDPATSLPSLKDQEVRCGCRLNQAGELISLNAGEWRALGRAAVGD